MTKDVILSTHTNRLPGITTPPRRSLLWSRWSPWSRVSKYWWTGWRASSQRPSCGQSTPRCRTLSNSPSESHSGSLPRRRRRSSQGQWGSKFIKPYVSLEVIGCLLQQYLLWWQRITCRVRVRIRGCLVATYEIMLWLICIYKLLYHA